MVDEDNNLGLQEAFVGWLCATPGSLLLIFLTTEKIFNSLFEKGAQVGWSSSSARWYLAGRSVGVPLHWIDGE